MRKTAILLLAAALPVFAQSTTPQLRTPRVSPTATIRQQIGLTDVTINFSRPGVKGRQIWGALVPYDKVWRTGANEATTIEFSDDVTINGKPLPKGKYSLHTIPGKDKWTLVFNSDANQWGSFNYDAAKDSLRVEAKPESAPMMEWMTFDIPQLSNDAATIVLRWEKLAVPFTVNANTTAKVMEQARAMTSTAAATDWATPLRAGSFAFEAGAIEDAARWSDQALKAGENMQTLWLKARIAQKQGRKADAVRLGEQALAKATDKDNKDFVAFIRGEVDSWKK